jgi:hypothetical protein
LPTFPSHDRQDCALKNQDLNPSLEKFVLEKLKLKNNVVWG